MTFISEKYKIDLDFVAKLNIFYVCYLVKNEDY